MVAIGFGWYRCTRGEGVPLKSLQVMVHAPPATQLPPATEKGAMPKPMSPTVCPLSDASH